MKLIKLLGNRWFVIITWVTVSGFSFWLWHMSGKIFDLWWSGFLFGGGIIMAVEELTIHRWMKEAIKRRMVIFERIIQEEIANRQER